jgi:signal peptide peptidase SppA
MIGLRGILNRPLALLPSNAATLLDLLTKPQAAITAESPRQDPYTGYAVQSGVGIVSVKGVLMHGNTNWWEEGATYDAIRRSLAACLEDPEVRAIALHCNSPGGDVAGCFDLADAVFAMRGQKPVWAILDECAFSAAYALACACDRITVPRTGGVGSIGCIMLHADITGMLEEVGVKVTTIQFGDQKSEGYPTTPMKGAALKRAQALIDEMGEMFVSQVARNRGISAKSVRDTEAGIFLGSAGVAAGLADEVLSPDEAFIALVESIN